MTEKILTGVDGSESAYKAAKKAASLALAFNAELHIVSAFHVDMAQTLRTAGIEQAPTDITDAYADLVEREKRSAFRAASSVAQTLKEKFPPLRIVHKAVEGLPGSVLVREATKLSADVIVVGNRRVQGPGRILGSIARTVANDADCDLYVVHTHDS